MQLCLSFLSRYISRWAMRPFMGNRDFRTKLNFFATLWSFFEVCVVEFFVPWDLMNNFYIITKYFDEFHFPRFWTWNTLICTMYLGKATAGDAGFSVLISVLGEFAWMMIASAILGTFSSLMVALILKHVDLRRNPSLEFGMMLLGSYFPYCCAEAMDLSGITSILFAGIGPGCAFEASQTCFS